MSRSLAALALTLVACVAGAEERIADIRQGTNLSVALVPGGTTLVEINVTGAGAAEMNIELVGLYTLTALDFVL